MLNHAKSTQYEKVMDTVLEGFQELAEELEMDDEIRNDLLRSFLVRCDGFLSSLQAVLETGDSELFERTTHSLKGLSGNMRFHRLNQLNETYTSAVHNGKTNEAQQVLSDMRDEFKTIEKAVLPVIGQ